MKRNRWIRACLCAVTLLALLCAPALAKTVSPNSDFYYLDNANVLSGALEGEIFFSNKLLYDACGAQIVVVTVNTTGSEAIDDYAYSLFNSWGIGDVAKNNGFLLLLAIDDEDYYALPGSGLDSRFSAGTIKDYYDRYLEADFAAGSYEAGVRKFFEAVFERVSDAYNAGVTVSDGVAAYKEYVSENTAAEGYGYGGYNGSRRNEARGSRYGEREDTGLGFGFLFVLLLIIVLIVVMSKGRRARRRTVVMPPPPPAVGFGRPTVGYRVRSNPRYPGAYAARPPRTSGWGSGWSSGSSSSHSSFGGSSSSRSSFGGGSSSRSSFGGGHSGGGFGGGHSGGGGSRGGGAGRGR